MQTNGRSSSLGLWIAGALGLWLGILALRAYVAMVVWNAAEDAPALTMGLIALSVFAVGLLAWVPARFLGGSRPAWRFGLLLAVLTLLRQALPGELLSPALSFATVIAWLWWLPAFLQVAARRGAAKALVPAVLLGLVAQVAGQTALHGIEITLLTGLWSVLGALLLVGTFLVLLYQSMGAPAPETALSRGVERGVARGALLLGPYLFVQMTYLTQLGRAQMLTGWSLAAVSGIIQLSLLVALLMVIWSPPRLIRILLGLVAIALLVPGELSGSGYLGLLVIQPGLAVALDAAFRPTSSEAVLTRPVSGSIYGLTAAGAFSFFVLLFLFYSVYGMPILWPIGAVAVVALGAIPGASTPVERRLSPALVGVGAGLLGLAGTLIPASSSSVAAGPAPRELKVLNYNIHQGFDYYSAPGLQRLARVIEESGADLVGLQEIPRGANLSGGHDLASWLRWRFPGYQVVYGPKAGDMFGNIIMSRYPLGAWGSERYDLVTEDSIANQASPPRGLVWATLSTDGGELLFISTHLTAYSGYDADREAQAEALVKRWNGRGRTIIAGDFNAGPGDQAIKSLVAAGLQDLPAAKGLGATTTYPAIEPNERLDYLFGSADLEAVTVEVGGPPASDHLPVRATIRLK